ncbi:hypothetical protein B0H14DRAFT_2826883, partial [Mycena olivaceomarginata]
MPPTGIFCDVPLSTGFSRDLETLPCLLNGYLHLGFLPLILWYLVYSRSHALTGNWKPSAASKSNYLLLPPYPLISFSVGTGSNFPVIRYQMLAFISHLVHL